MIFSTKGLRICLVMCLSLLLLMTGCGLLDSNREGGDGDDNTGDDNRVVIVTPTTC